MCPRFKSSKAAFRFADAGITQNQTPCRRRSPAAVAGRSRASVLILGDSGIGKSECALELLKRGHMLVADDRVDIHHKPGGILIGSGNMLVQHTWKFAASHHRRLEDFRRRRQC